MSLSDLIFTTSTSHHPKRLVIPAKDVKKFIKELKEQISEYIVMNKKLEDYLILTIDHLAGDKLIEKEQEK